MMWLKPAQARTLEELALAAAPCEVCGLLLGYASEVVEIVPIANVARDPVREFRMEERAFVRAMFDAPRRGLALLGFFHSHPSGDCTPSQTDIRQSTYPDALTLIIGLKGSPTLGVWRLRNGRAELTELVIQETPPPSHPERSGQTPLIMVSALLAVLILVVLSLVLLPPPPMLPAP